MFGRELDNHQNVEKLSSDPNSQFYWKAELTRLSMKIVLFKLFNVDTKKDILERTYTTLDEFSKGRAIDEPGLDTKTASQYWRDYNALLNKLDRYISQTDVSKYLCVMESDSCEIVSKTEEKIKDLKDKSKLLGNNFNSSFVSS